MVSHLTGARGHRLHVTRSPWVVTVRGESLRASPVRSSYPREVDLERGARSVLLPGESLEPLPRAEPVTGSPIIQNYRITHSQNGLETMNGLRITPEGNASASADKTASKLYRFTVWNSAAGTHRTADGEFSGVDATLSEAGRFAARAGLELFPRQHVYRSKSARNGDVLRGKRNRWTRAQILSGNKGVGWVFIHPAELSESDVLEAIRDALELPTNAQNGK